MTSSSGSPVRRLLVASLLLNAVLVAGVVFFVTAFDDLLGAYVLDPAWERRFSFFEAHPIQAGDVVFLGDSITEGAEWGELLPGLPARNRGIGGDTSQGVLDRLEQIVEGRPAQLFVMIGTNDLGRGENPAAVAANVASLLARMREGSPGTELFVQSVLPRSAGYAERIALLNERLRAVAAEHGATWIDLAPAFQADDGSLDAALTNDDLHLLAEGYTRWRDALRPHVLGGVHP